MKCANMMPRLFVLAIIAIIGTNVEADYCSLNFTAPENCLRKAKDKWQDQDSDQSTVNILNDACKEVGPT